MNFEEDHPEGELWGLEGGSTNFFFTLTWCWFDWTAVSRLSFGMEHQSVTGGYTGLVLDGRIGKTHVEVMSSSCQRLRVEFSFQRELVCWQKYDMELVSGSAQSGLVRSESSMGGF